MAAILLAPIYIGVNVYVIWRIFFWMAKFSTVFQSSVFQWSFAAIYLIFASSLLTGFLVKKPEKLRRALKYMGNYFLGIFLYVLMPIVALEVFGMIGTKLLRWGWVQEGRTLQVAGSICAAVMVCLILYGIHNARKIRVTTYHVKVEKAMQGKTSLKIVLAADLHLGYNSGEIQTRKIVSQINRQKPDLVCIAGDLFDNEFEAIKNPERVKRALREIKAECGVYGCWGNHDINEKILAGFTFHHADGSGLIDERMERFVKDAGIVMLNDEVRLIDGKFYLAGRKDATRAKKIENGRMTPRELLGDLDKSKPIFVMDHQPKELQEIAEAGADLDLCGHTHGGQIFPGNLAVDLGWENAWGCLKKGQMYNIVTSGVGIWGPNMRIGTKSEICVIQVEFEEER